MVACSDADYKGPVKDPCTYRLARGLQEPSGLAVMGKSGHSAMTHHDVRQCGQADHRPVHQQPERSGDQRGGEPAKARLRAC